MKTLLRWLLPILGGLLGNYLARKFSGECPLDAASWACVHWEGLASFAGVILGAFGYRVTRPKLVKAKAAQRIAPPVPVVTTTSTVSGEVVYVEPSRWGENVAQNDEPGGPGGGIGGG